MIDDSSSVILTFVDCACKMEAPKATYTDFDDDGADSYDDDDDYPDENYALANSNEILSPLDESDIVKCDICREYVVRTVLREHREVQHSACRCIACGLEYTKQSELLDHLRAKHLNDWDSLKCQFCAKVVTRKSNLLQHIVYRHSTLQTSSSYPNKNIPMPAEIRTQNLDSVTNMETQTSLFSCDICSASFASEASLDNHKQQTHDRDRYACSFCKMTYSHLDDLIKHMKALHTGGRYKCPGCESKFNRRDNMVKHASKAHGISVESEAVF